MLTPLFDHRDVSANLGIDEKAQALEKLDSYRYNFSEGMSRCEKMAIDLISNIFEESLSLSEVDVSISYDKVACLVQSDINSRKNRLDRYFKLSLCVFVCVHTHIYICIYLYV